MRPAHACSSRSAPRTCSPDWCRAFLVTGSTQGDTALQLSLAQLLVRGVALDLAYLNARDPANEPVDVKLSATAMPLRGSNAKAPATLAPKTPMPQKSVFASPAPSVQAAPAPTPPPAPKPAVSFAPP